MDDECWPPTHFMPTVSDYDEVTEVWSGLLFEDGSPIMHYYVKEPLGFLVHDEDGSLRPRHELFP